MVEDFGYQRDKEQSRIAVIIKRAFLIGAVLFSISCFIYITISAYYFVYHDQNNDVATIKSPDFPIKVVEEENKGGAEIKDIDKTIYESIISSKRGTVERGPVNVIKIPDEPLSPAIASSRKVEGKNIIKSSLVNNKSKDSKLIVYDAGSEFKTIDQNARDSVQEQPLTEVKKLPVAANDNKSKKNVSRVQLAAMNSTGAADEYWARLNSKYPRLFSGLKHFVQEVNLGQKGTFYRLQIGDFRSQVEAEEFCIKFIAGAQKTKSDCIVVE